MVVQYVNSQLELLNIPQMKIDFYDFYDRMKKVEARMNEKMKQVEMLYEEVDAGFQRNARDRSDYLNDFERMNNLAEVQVSGLKEQMSEFQGKFDRLEYCILSIVNEDEAAQLRLHRDPGANASGQINENTIRVNVPQPGALL